jgi:adenylate cyclase
VGGLVGSGDQLGYTVHGDEVNLAARLEQLNKHYQTQIMVSPRTRELAGVDALKFRKIESVTVRGRQSPVFVYSVES